MKDQESEGKNAQAHESESTTRKQEGGSTKSASGEAEEKELRHYHRL